MRALTLWQPHATLMALRLPEPNPHGIAEKVFETRPQWARRVPLGTLVIHAAKSDADLHTVRDPLLRDVFRKHYPSGTRFGDFLPLGAAVAVVDVVTKWETTAAGPWRLLAVVDGVTPPLPGELPSNARVFGDFAPGRILLQCQNVRPLVKPVPMRGYQQLWNLNVAQEAKVISQLPASAGTEA